MVAEVFGVSGATGFDSHAGIPTSAKGSGTAASVTISTSNANDFIIGSASDGNGETWTSGTGFVKVNINVCGGRGCTENSIVSSTQTNLAVTWTVISHQYAMIVDAVVQAT